MVVTSTPDQFKDEVADEEQFHRHEQPVNYILAMMQLLVRQTVLIISVVIRENHGNETTEKVIPDVKWSTRTVKEDYLHHPSRKKTDENI